VIAIAWGKWKTRHIDAAAIGLCVLIAVPFSFPRINPLMRPPDYGAQQAAQLAVLRSSTQAADKAVALQKARLAEMRADLARQTVPLQPARNVNRRLAELTDLAAGAGLEVSEIVPAAAVAGSRFDTVPIRIRGTGSYPTCAAFLCKLTRAFPDTSVNSFELSGEPDKPHAPAAFRVQLAWYATPSAAAAAP
jgi:Tfp pilus assembly protein PilO